MICKKGFVSTELIIIGALLLVFGIFASNRYMKSGFSQAVSMDKHMSDVFGTGIVYEDPEPGPTPVVPETPEVPETPVEPESVEFTIRYNAMGGSYVPNREPGLYTQETTNLLHSWDELISGDLITVEDGIITYVDSSLRGDLVIAEGVTTIIRDVGLDTGGMRLYNVFLPKTISNIDVVGLNNSYLRNIYVAADNPYFQSINGALYSKDSKTLLRFPKGRKPKYIVIPNGTETIDYDAVSYTKISYVIIPSSVKTIGRYAFNGNGTIQSVYYTGTADQWNDINISSTYNFYLTDARIVCNYIVMDEDGLYNINEVTYKDAATISGTYREPIMQGHTFGGWYTDPDCTPGKELDLSKVTKDISAYAKWN